MCWAAVILYGFYTFSRVEGEVWNLKINVPAVDDERELYYTWLALVNDSQDNHQCFTFTFLYSLSYFTHIHCIFTLSLIWKRGNDAWYLVVNVEDPPGFLQASESTMIFNHLGRKTQLKQAFNYCYSRNLITIKCNDRI